MNLRDLERDFEINSLWCLMLQNPFICKIYDIGIYSSHKLSNQVQQICPFLCLSEISEHNFILKQSSMWPNFLIKLYTTLVRALQADGTAELPADISEENCISCKQYWEYGEFAHAPMSPMGGGRLIIYTQEGEDPGQVKPEAWEPGLGWKSYWHKSRISKIQDQDILVSDVRIQWML